jgi:predicted secreted hydrolase
MLLTALTDLQTGQHYYAQYQAFFGKHITANLRETSFDDRASIRYTPNATSAFGEMYLAMHADEYDLHLSMHAKKAPVWHCADGTLQMGILNDPKQITYYYSLTNLHVDGVLRLNGKEHRVSGKAWFDRQGGPCRLTNPLTNWEWFSFRLFDEEEIMLFSFPRTGYRDGTYIRGDGSAQRLNEYEIEPLSYVNDPATGYSFSSGWRITMVGGKAKEYLVQPVMKGQLNLFFFELLADVIDTDGNRVGYCVVELLPGARNKRIKPWLALK